MKKWTINYRINLCYLSWFVASTIRFFSDRNFQHFFRRFEQIIIFIGYLNESYYLRILIRNNLWIFKEDRSDFLLWIISLKLSEKESIKYEYWNFKLPIQALSLNLISIESFQIQIHHITDILTIDTPPIINRRNSISRKMLGYTLYYNAHACK